MGISLWLDTLPRNSNRHHRCGCRRFRALPRRAVPLHFAHGMDHSPVCAFVEVRHKPVRAATRWDIDDCVYRVPEYAGRAPRQAHSKHFHQRQGALDDRVASAALAAVFGPAGAAIMAVAIIISTFGCNNGLILAGARVSYAMARDGLFFRSTGTLNKKGVPGSALVYQGIWISVLILLRTRHVDASGAVSYGNLYSDLLDYVVFSVLIFYALTIAGIFVLRAKRPDAERPYRAFGYPFIPLLYIVAAVAIMFVLLLYKTQTTWPGLVIVLLGVPVYLLWSRGSAAGKHAA